jgi:D-alanyl-lipoteichoic acid acyltransferase DltB (MBOAT superfamily)
VLFVQPFFLFVLLPVGVAAAHGAARVAGPTSVLAVIVAVSAVFYAPHGLLPSLLLVVSLCLNFAIGLALSGPDTVGPRGRKALLGLGLAYNFSTLAIFKYLDAVAVLVDPAAGPLVGIAIPAGISFYTFHQAVFLVDAYARSQDVVRFFEGARGAMGHVRAFTRYGAFVAFFPQLVIGPITYMSEVAPQLLRRELGRLRSVDLQVGATLIVIGLFKKLCVADPLAAVIDPIYSAADVGQLLSPAQAAFAIAGYFFQLYFDFSGYADIAIGIARLFGIRLPINFDSPLRATGIVDFYRRWHITLTRVIAVFLFTPLSVWGTRVALERGYRGWRRRALSSWLPFLVNFQVIALWHAAKETFLLFGLVHGVWYVLETEVRATAAFKAFRLRTSDRLRTVTGMAVTVAPLMMTFALFRSSSLETFWHLLGRLTTRDGRPPEVVYFVPMHWLLLGLVAAGVYLLPNAYDLLRRYRPGIVTFQNESTSPEPLRAVWRPTVSWALVVSMLAVAVFMRVNHVSPFLYGAF